jgi:hypothetical protein
VADAVSHIRNQFRGCRKTIKLTNLSGSRHV